MRPRPASGGVEMTSAMRAFQRRRTREAEAQKRGRPTGSRDSYPRNAADLKPGGETIAEARQRLDAQFPWLRGVEKAVR